MTTDATPAELTDAQRDAARSGWDPDHVLTDAKLVETATDGLRFAATELRWAAHEIRSEALELDGDGLLSASEQNVYGRVIARLRARADELDPR